jgi:4-amino-4-deoxy-L-arabinose transferase-like glycosyltransferase
MAQERAALSERAGYLWQLAAVGGIGALVAFLTINRLGTCDVCGSNEAVEAVFVQQMVEHGQWLFPLDNGRDPMYKPPLFHWTETALDRLLRIEHVTAFNLRLTSAVYAIACALLLTGFALSRLRLQGAVMSGLLLAASYEFVSQGRIGRVDMTLTFFETLSLLTFLVWLEAPESPAARRKALQYLLAASLGLGALAKGPVGLLLPGATVGVFLALEGRWTDLRRLFTPLSVLLMCSVASSWYLACLLGRQFGTLTRQVGSENLGRFFGSLGRMSAWYYVQPLLLNAGPLSLVVPAIVGIVLVQYRNLRDRQVGSAEVDARADRMARLCAIFWVVTVIFFELAAYKRKSYLLPLSPVSALLIAWWVYRYRIPRFGRMVPRTIIATCVALVIANFLFIPWREAEECGAVLTLGETIRWACGDRQTTEQIRSRQTDSYRQLAAEVNRAVGSDDAVLIYGFDQSVEPLGFYLDRNTVPLIGPLDNAPPGYILAPSGVWTSFSAGRSRFSELLAVPHGEGTIVLLHSNRAGGESGS